MKRTVAKHFFRQTWVIVVVAAALLLSTAILAMSIRAARRTEIGVIKQVEMPDMKSVQQKLEESEAAIVQPGYTVRLITAEEARIKYAPERGAAVEGAAVEAEEAREWSEQQTIPYAYAADDSIDIAARVLQEDVSAVQADIWWEDGQADAAGNVGMWRLRAVFPDGRWFETWVDPKTGMIEDFRYGGSNTETAAAWEEWPEVRPGEIWIALKDDLSSRFAGALKGEKLWWVYPGTPAQALEEEWSGYLSEMQGEYSICAVTQDGVIYLIGYEVTETDGGTWKGELRSFSRQGYWMGANDIPAGAVIINERKKAPYVLPQYELGTSGAAKKGEFSSERAAGLAVKYAEQLFDVDANGSKVLARRGIKEDNRITVQIDTQKGEVFLAGIDLYNGQLSFVEKVKDGEQEASFETGEWGAFLEECVKQTDDRLKSYLLKGDTVRKLIPPRETQVQPAAGQTFYVFLNSGALYLFVFDQAGAEENGAVLRSVSFYGEGQAREIEQRIQNDDPEFWYF